MSRLQFLSLWFPSHKSVNVLEQSNGIHVRQHILNWCLLPRVLIYRHQVSWEVTWHDFLMCMFRGQADPAPFNLGRENNFKVWKKALSICRVPSVWSLYIHDHFYSLILFYFFLLLLFTEHLLATRKAPFSKPREHSSFSFLILWCCLCSISDIITLETETPYGRLLYSWVDKCDLNRVFPRGLCELRW